MMTITISTLLTLLKIMGTLPGIINFLSKRKTRSNKTIRFYHKSKFFGETMFERK